MIRAADHIAIVSSLCHFRIRMVVTHLSRRHEILDRRCSSLLFAHSPIDQILLAGKRRLVVHGASELLALASEARVGREQAVLKPSHQGSRIH